MFNLICKSKGKYFEYCGDVNAVTRTRTGIR